jgi:hypothetical protein
MKLSQATSHVKWLNIEQTNALKTDDKDIDVSQHINLFAV